MKLDKVYVGFTNDGKDRCLYKTYGYYNNGVCYTKFIDLNSNESFDISEVDTNSLKSYSEVFPNCKKRERKRKVIHTYKCDRNQRVSIMDLVYADIYKRGILDPISKDNLMVQTGRQSFIRVNDSQKFYKSDEINKIYVENIRDFFKGVSFDDYYHYFYDMERNIGRKTKKHFIEWEYKVKKKELN